MKQEVINIICHALASSMPMLVLRGADIHARTGGDIDILVPSRQALRACLLVAEAAKSAGWRLVGFRDIRYLAQMVLVRPSSGQEEDEAIKLDFFSGFEWYGIGSDVVSRRFFQIAKNSIRTESDRNRLAAAVNFIQKCLIVGRLSERDWARVINGGATSEFLLELSRALDLPLSAHDMERRGVSGLSKWRLRAASAGIGGMDKFAFWFPRVMIAHLRFKLGVGTHLGHKIGLSGLDGSGKSTQMGRLFAAYRKAGCAQPRLVHLLPNWIPMPHNLLRRKKTEQNYTKPYAEAPVQSKLSGFVRLCYYLTAFTVAKWWMRSLTKRGEVIILDRSFLDFAVDLTRSRIPDSRLPNWLVKLCAPSGSVLFLDALPETVVCRKGELQFNKALELRRRYLSIFKLVNGAVIDAEGMPNIVFTDILDQIDTVYRTRLATVVAQ